MAFKRLSFSRLWTNARDFPTVETDEIVVRADMQSLHDETKNSLNTLMSDLENRNAATSIGATDSSGAASTVQAEIGKLRQAQSGAGYLPSGGTSGQILSKSSSTNYDAKWIANPALLRSGGTMTGAITLAADPTSAKHAATKQYVDTAESNAKAYADAKGVGYTYSTTDLTAGSSSLTTGKLYFVYE